MKFFKLVQLVLIVHFEYWRRGAVLGRCGPLIPRISQNIEVTCLGPIRCKTPGETVPNGAQAVIKCLDNYETRAGTAGRKVLACDWSRNRWIGAALFNEMACKIKCGRSATENVGLVINGTETERLKWPWHVALFINNFYACGGSIINPFGNELFILTAVHCLARPDGTPLDIKLFKIVVGAVSSNLNENSQTSNTQVFNVKQIARHENYDLQRHLEDIAIIQTDKPIRVTPYALPVCLPSNEIMVSGQVKAGTTSGVVVGFGSTTGVRQAASEKLHEVTLPVATTDACHSIIDQRPSVSQICAGTPHGANACSGDSGGGLVFQEKHPVRYTIQGIVSSAPQDYRCHGISIFTRVFTFIHWIEIESDKFVHKDLQVTVPTTAMTMTYRTTISTTPTATPSPRTTPTTTPTLPTTTVGTTTLRPIVTTTRAMQKQLNDYETIAVDLHNKYRKKHSAPPVSIDSQLSQKAQRWADHLVQTNSNLKHGADCSENLFELSGTGGMTSPIETIRSAIDSWYKANRNYKPEDPEPSTYTQLVWKSSNKIGVGIASKTIDKSRGHRTVVVVCYSPAGNIVGENGKYFRNNVFPR